MIVWREGCSVGDFRRALRFASRMTLGSVTKVGNTEAEIRTLLKVVEPSENREAATFVTPRSLIPSIERSC